MLWTWVLVNGYGQYDIICIYVSIHLSISGNKQKINKSKWSDKRNYCHFERSNRRGDKCRNLDFAHKKRKFGSIFVLQNE